MVIYLIIVTSQNLVSVDVYHSHKDAQARKVRAEQNFPPVEGFTVVLLEKHVTPELSTVFS